MHEFSLAQSLVEQITELASKEGASRVTRVEVTIGAMSGVMKDPFEFCFPEAIRGSCLEGCTLIIKEAPLRVHCNNCASESLPEQFAIRCGVCQGQDVKIIEGKDFLLNSVEVE